MVFGKEICPHTGKKHLQGYFHLPNTKTASAVHKLISLDGIWIKPANGPPSSNFDYCSADGDFAEWGTRPADPVTQCKINNDAYRHFIQLSKDSDFKKIEELYPSLYVKYNNMMYRTAAKYAKKPDALSGCCGEWWYGPKSTGKTTAAHKLNPFVKSKDKWWDGWDNSDPRTVYIDECDKSDARWLGPFLKIWADATPFRAAVKGTMIFIRPPRIIVSSNYTFDELWPDDSILAGAIADRFKVRTFSQVYRRRHIDDFHF